MRSVLKQLFCTIVNNKESVQTRSTMDNDRNRTNPDRMEIPVVRIPIFHNIKMFSDVSKDFMIKLQPRSMDDARLSGIIAGRNEYAG